MTGDSFQSIETTVSRRGQTDHLLVLKGASIHPGFFPAMLPLDRWREEMHSYLQRGIVTTDQ